jgi:hypothetical protein
MLCKKYLRIFVVVVVDRRPGTVTPFDVFVGCIVVLGGELLLGEGSGSQQVC